MLKVQKAVKGVSANLLIIGFSLQILLGFLWFINNITGLKSMLALIYMGSAFFAAYVLLHAFFKCNNKLIVWASLALVTFPTAMQLHMQNHELSIICTFLMLGLAYVLENRKNFLIYIAIICAVAIFSQIVSNSEKDLNFAEKMMSRLMWPNVESSYDEWPEEARDAIKYNRVKNFYKYPETFPKKISKTLLKTKSRSEVNAIELRIAFTTFMNNKSTVMHDVFFDAAAYALSPIFIERQLGNKLSDSYTPINYDEFRKNAPEISNKYMHFSCVFFGVALLICIVNLILNLFVKLSEKAEEKKTKTGPQHVLVGILCALMVLWNTMQGSGMMDYKKTVFITLITIVYMFGITIFKFGGKNEGED